LALVSHEDGDTIEPGDGWMIVWAGRTTTLLQTPLSHAGKTTDGPLPGPRWVLGEPTSWASDWTALLDAPETVQPIPHEAVAGGRFESIEAWSRADEVRAIDFFCGAGPDDPTGEMATEHFVGFVQALVSARLGNANHVCRVSVVTHRAALDVEHPRGSALWGAVRSMAMEVGDEAKLDFRLVDLGDRNDLRTLAGLAGSRWHQSREEVT
jgi:hypothetical protein